MNGRIEHFLSCDPKPAKARPQVATVNFASLVSLLAARPFVHPTLPNGGEEGEANPDALSGSVGSPEGLRP